MSKETIIWSDCKKCECNTRHEILHSHSVSPDDEYSYPEEENWQVIRCLGCHNISFRYEYRDLLNVYDDGFGNYHLDSDEYLYPQIIKNHKKLDSIELIPQTIKTIYEQTISAFGAKLYLLASIGLRATIEAICNHLDIAEKKPLDKRIEQLSKQNYVSLSDKKRLHAIRFLGNDAAHEIITPGESELFVALEIVEHLLKSLFILEHKSKNLETTKETYDEFITLLNKCINSEDGIDKSTPVSLSIILGKKRRLIGQNLIGFESELIKSIESGKYTLLNLNTVAKIDGREVQLYTINIDEDEIT